MKILLAVDGSEYSDVAVHTVANRPWPTGTIVKLFSVMELPFVPTTETWALPDNYYAQLETVHREKAADAIEKSLKALRASAGMVLEIISEIKTGQAQEAILHEADEWGADLIVIGSHGYRGFKRFLLGSVSQAIASHAKCSVEIVRRRNAPESEQ